MTIMQPRLSLQSALPLELTPADVAFLGIGLAAAFLLSPQDLIFMTVVCLLNHGLAALLIRPVLVDNISMQRQALALVSYGVSLACLEFEDILDRIIFQQQVFSFVAFSTPVLLGAFGFIVFDHIYAVYWRLHRPSLSVTEDVASAVMILYLLTVVISATKMPTGRTTLVLPDKLGFKVRIWLLYKLARCLYAIRLVSHSKQRIFTRKEMRPTGLLKRHEDQKSIQDYTDKVCYKESCHRSPVIMKINKLKPIVSTATGTELVPVHNSDRSKEKMLLQPKSPLSEKPLSGDKVMMKLSAAKMKESGLYWEIHGLAYDLTDFIHRHPGGKEALLLGRGRDCTALFESYHPFSHEICKAVLEKYRAGGGPASSHNLTLTYGRERDYFYEVLCKRVAETLRSKGLDPVRGRAATSGRIAYYGIITAAVFVSAFYHAKGSIVASVFLALFGWFWGALGHDAGHFAASRYAVVNEAGVWAMSLLCNPIMWQHQHTYAHHSFTNDFDRDPDLHHFDNLLRVHKRFQHHNIFKYQTNPWFVLFAYSFVVFGTCVWIPISMLLEGSLYGLVEWTDRNRPLRAAGMFLHLITFVWFIIIWPFVGSGLAWYRATTAVVLHLLTSGLLFALFSQINHLNELSIEVRNEEDNNRDERLRNSWAIAQIETSNNFCTDSLFWHLFSNGLNLQIEHHLFPGLNHAHLQHIAPTVEATCREFGVRYKHYAGWSEIFRATLIWLDHLASEEGSKSKSG